MFGLTFEKLLLIGVIAVFVIGPERLPAYSAKFGQLVRKLKEMSSGAKDRIKEELGDDFDEEEWKKLDPRQYDPRRIIREALVEERKLEIFEQPWFMEMMRLVLAALVIVVLILAIVKPMIKKLIYPEDTSESYDEHSLSRGLDLGDDTIDMLSKEFDAKSVGFAADGTLMLPDLHGDDDLLRAVRALVANEPELSSLVVKNWLAEDE